MEYEFNGKLISIPEDEIENLKVNLQLTNQEAIDTWLVDNDYDIDEMQENLEKKAKKEGIDHQIEMKKPTKERKKPIIKTSDEKKELFKAIYGHLDEILGDSVEILKENKLISVQIGDKCFKIDVIEQRQPKNK